MKKLVVLRHGERINDTEELIESTKQQARVMRERLDRSVGRFDLSAVSGFDRARNTYKEMGYTDLPRIAKELSSSVDDWRDVDWRGNFSRVRKSYLESQASRELGDKHARLYRTIMEDGPQKSLLITHDSRIEYALASLFDGSPEIEKFGEAIGYLEGCEFHCEDHGVRSVRTLRRDPKLEIEVETYIPLVGGRR